MKIAIMQPYFFPYIGDFLSRDELYNHLKKNNIYGRRCFYPLINDFPTYRGLSSAFSDNLPVAETMAAQVICLPI